MCGANYFTVSAPDRLRVRNASALVFAVFTGSPKIKDCGALGLQFKGKTHSLWVGASRCRVAMDSCSAGNSVQSFIAQHQTIRSDFSLQVLSAALSLHATDFEDVGEIRGKSDAQRHREGLHSIINELQFLVC